MFIIVVQSSSFLCLRTIIMKFLHIIQTQNQNICKYTNLRPGNIYRCNSWIHFLLPPYTHIPNVKRLKILHSGLLKQEKVRGFFLDVCHFKICFSSLFLRVQNFLPCAMTFCANVSILATLTCWYYAWVYHRRYPSLACCQMTFKNVIKYGLVRL